MHPGGSAEEGRSLNLIIFAVVYAEKPKSWELVHSGNRGESKTVEFLCGGSGVSLATSPG